MTEKSFILDIDYYLEEGRVVFTSQYLKNKGVCCSTGCRHCPFHPKHTKDSKNTDIDEETEIIED
jgi:biotin synthase-like enzyme